MKLRYCTLHRYSLYNLPEWKLVSEKADLWAVDAKKCHPTVTGVEYKLKAK